MKKVYLVILLCIFIAGPYAMSFEKYLDTVFEKSDIQRDVKLYKKSNYWEKMNNLGMIIPRMDVTLEAPSYSFTDETEYTDAYGKPYSREKYSYGGNISLSQYLPTNTEIYSNMYYNHYKNYREAGVEENNLTGQTIEVTVNQKIWGINKGYHYYKKWRNISKINNIENKRFNLDILQKAYEKYINYLITKKSYQLNKLMYKRYKNIFESAKNKYRMGLYDLITYNRIKKEYKFYEI